MKRLLKNIALFIPLFLIGYVLVICVIGEFFPSYFGKPIRYRRFGGGHLYTRLQEVRTVKDVDILFIGPSHCYRGFDTRIFRNAGYRSFNLGSSIQTPIQSELLMKKYLDRLNPKLVVYEVSPVAFASDGVESSTDLISNGVVDLDVVKMALTVNSIRAYNTLIFAFYRQWTGIKKHETELRRYGNDTYISGGFVETNRTHYREKEVFSPKPYDFNAEQFEVFDRILAELKRRDIKYLLVQAPLTRGLYHSKTNNDVFDSIMHRRGKYYNFNELLQLTDTLDFYDSTHLNQKGVAIFNDSLIGILKKERPD